MLRTKRRARISRRAESSRRNRRFQRRRPLLLEPLEPRRLLAHLELTAIADGLVADRDLDGTFETVDSSTNSISNRWFDLPDIGQERGVFEFDLTSIPNGVTVTSAKIGLDIVVHNFPPDPELEFRAFAGDGSITVADGDAVSAAAGTGTVPDLGYREFVLDPAAIQPHINGQLGIRIQNTELDGSWVGIASLESSFDVDPKLILDYEPLDLTVAIQANAISEGDGAGATTAVITRNGDLSQDLSVTLASNDTSEATVSSPITIPALSASVQVDLDAADDFKVDGTQTVTITASANGYTDGVDTVDVTDDDTAGITVNPVSGLVTTESGGTGQFTIVLDTEPTANVSVDVHSTDTGEGTVSPSTVTFTPSNWDTPKAVTVTGRDDITADGDQPYTVVTGMASSNDVHYGSPAEPIVVDDVERGEFIASGSNVNGTDFMVVGEHTTYGEYRAFLTFDLADITIPATGASLSLQVDNYNATSGLDFTVYDYVSGNDAQLGSSMTSVDAFNDLGSGQVYGSASITSSANPIGSTFTIPLSAAAVADINGKSGGLFTVGFADDLISGGNNGNVRLDRDPSFRVNQLLIWANRPGIDPPDVEVTNQDNENPTLSVSVMADAVAENAGIEATALTIRRNTDTASDLVVDLQSSDTSEVTVPTTATIPAGHDRVTVFLDAVDDTDVDGATSVTVTASRTGYTSGADSLTVTDVESDFPGDRVWHDANADGLQDGGEMGVAGAVVELFESSDAIVGNADDVSRGIDITDSQGYYQLPGLVDGNNYYLAFRTPAGYTFTTQDAGSDDTLDSDAGSSGITPMFVHSAGQNQQHWDAGLVDGPPDFGFAARAGGPIDDNATAMETDAAGNVYVTGVFRETVDFDFGPGTHELQSCNTDDVYVAKYTPQGALIWARSIWGSGIDASYALAVTDSGDVVVTGTYQGTADFDPTAGTYERTSAGSNDIFVWKLDSAGDFLWAGSMGGTNYDVSRSLAIMPDGGVVMTGQFLGTADFDPGTGVSSLVNSSTSYPDVFIVRLDAAGDFGWAKRVGGTRWDIGYDVTVGTDGSVLTSGSFQNSVDFDPGTGTFSLTSVGSYDAFLLKLTSAGDFVWAKSWGGTDVDVGYETEFGTDGSVYTAGAFRRTVDFDPGPGTFEIEVSGSQDGFVSKLDPAGNFLWAKAWGGSGYAQLGDMKLDSDDTIYLAGHFPSTVDFDPGTSELLRTSAGSNDIYVNVLDRNGDLKWVQTFGGENDDLSGGVAIAPDGGAFLGGQFEGTADFDPRSGVFELTSWAGEDLFLVRLAPPAAPTAVQLLEDRVLEAQPPGTPVGVLAALDPDAGESFAFRLASGAGDTDNASFRVGDGRLWAEQTFDHATKSSYSIRVRATDSSGQWFEQPLTINVLPIAQAATIGNLVWQDSNANGLQDAGETGVAGAVVEAVSTADGIVRGQAVTNANGQYAINGLLPGVSYHAIVRPPAGYNFTTRDAGSDDAIDSDTDAVGKTGSFPLAAGETVDTLDSGLIGSQPYFGFASTIATAGSDRGRTITMDAAGNVYLAGLFYGEADFDPGPGVLLLGQASTTNAFVAKYTPNGALVWATSWNSTSLDTYDMAVAPDGSILLTGSFQSTVDFDPGPGEYLLTSKGSTDIFAAKLHSTGQLAWASQAGSTSYDRGYGLAYAADGSVYVTGYFRGIADFDPGPGTFNLTNSSYDAFVWKLDAQGDFLWAGRLGGTGSDYGYAMALTPTGNVVITGLFQNTADMDPGAGTSNLVSAGNSDVYITTLDAAGAFVSAGRMGGTTADVGYAIAVAADGSLFVGGTFSDTADLDPGAGTVNRTSVGANDVFVTKLDASGAFVMTAAWGGPNHDYLTDIATASGGGVYATGSFARTADFDPGPGVFERVANKWNPTYLYTDAYISRLSGGGELEWVQTFGGENSDVSDAMVVASDGSVYTTGTSNGTADFDPRSGVYAIPGGGGTDAFLSRLLPPQAPTGLALPENRVLELQPATTPVGNFAATDPEPGETFVFDLVSGTGSTDNASFTISDSALYTAAVFDHSVKQTYNIRVRARDSSGMSFEQPLTVTVLESTNAASLGDRVWHDQNSNGIQDGGEPGVAGVAVQAISTGDGLLRGTAVTDANGNYTVNGLPPDLSYQLRFRPPVGFDFTTQGAGGDDTTDSDADATGLTAAVSVTAGATIDHVDAGLVGAAPWFGYALGAGGVSTNTNVEDQGWDVATDADGNAYITGWFEETVDFDPGPGTYELTSRGGYDAFVAKYSPGGTLLWASSFGGLTTEAGKAIDLAPNGDVVVGGLFTTTADFLSGSGFVRLTAVNANEAFVARLDANGNLLWAKGFGGNDDDFLTDVDTAPDGSIAVTGYFEQTVDFDPGPGTANLTSSGYTDAFVLKLTDAGDYQWAHQFGSNSHDYGYGVAVAADGSVHTTGNFRNTVDFDPGTGTSNLTTNGYYDVFVSKLTASGNFAWAQKYGGTGYDYGYAITVGTDGSVYTAGAFNNTVDFDAGAGEHELTSAGGTDGFLVKTNASGNFTWVWHLAGVDSEYVDALALGPSDSVHATGYSTGGFNSPVDFDPGPETFLLSNADSGRDFVVSLTSTNDFQWARRVPASRELFESGIAVDASGSVILTSSFVNTADFGPGNSTFPLTANNQRDLFVWKVKPPVDPTAIALPEDRVMEQQPPGTVVGELTTTDADPGDAFTYEFVAGTGDDDNAAFRLDGDILLTAAQFDFATQSTYSIRVRATDSAGRRYEQALTVNVQNSSTAAAVGDRVWNDTNGNGIQDAGEPGIAGAVVEVFTADDDVSRGSTITDSNGNFTLGGLLAAKDYYLQFRAPVGFAFTTQDVGGDDAVDSDPAADGVTTSFTLAAGQSLSGWDAGLTGSAPYFGFALTAGDIDGGYATAIDLDSEGNAYVTGTFRGTVDLDPGPGVVAFSTTGTTQGGFVAKYTPGGALAWAAYLDGAGSTYGQAVHVGDDGHVYVTGSYIGDLNYRLGSAATWLDGIGTKDIFVAKLDAKGNAVWLKGFVGGIGSGQEILTAADGSVYTLGVFSNTIDFDPGPGTSDLSYVAGYNDVFVSKLDTNGDFVWAKRIAGSGGIDVTGADLAADGSLYYGGSFTRTIDFDPGTGVFNLSSSYSSYEDAYIAKLDADGNFAWARKTTATNREYTYGLAVADDGSVIATGMFQYSPDFDPGAGDFIMTASGSQDGFLWKLDAAGDFVWAKQFAGAAYTYGRDVEFASDGSFYSTTYFTASVDADPGPDTFTLTSAGGYDTFVAKFDAAVNLQWVHAVDAHSTYDMALAADGSLYTAGGMTETDTDFDPRGGEYRPPSAGGTDIFVARHLPPSTPTGVALPANRVFENQPIGTVVGGLQGIDPDEGELFTFALVPGTGDDDNASFAIEGNALVTAAVFNAVTKDTYSIRVEATDLSGLKAEAALTVRVAPLADAASAAGQIWIDVNANGLRDVNEPKVPSAVAELRTAGDQILRDTAVIAADGHYSFQNLIPNIDYVVVFRVPAGYTFTSPDAGADDTIDSDVDAQGITNPFSPTAGQALSGIDAGVLGTLPSFGFAVGIGSGSTDEGKEVGTDAAGNVYVTGTFQGAADFDPGPSETILSGLGNTDGFVAKYTRLGVLVWAQQIAGSSHVYARGMDVSDSGVLTIVGSFGGSVDFDPGPGELILDATSTSTFVVRWDADGELVWAKAFSGGVPTDLAIDSDGAIVASGRFSGTVDFDPGPGTANLTSAGGIDAYAVKLDETGAYVWARAFGGTDTEYAERIGVDSSGNVFVTGFSYGTGDFDPGPCDYSLIGGLFVVRLDAAGNLVWAKGVDDYGRALAVSSDGGTYGSGSFVATGDFDPGPGVYPLETHGSHDIPVFHFDPDGNLVWAVHLGGTGLDRAFDLAFDPDGNLVGAGSFEGSADFDPGAGHIDLTSAGDSDIVVFRLDSAGAAISAHGFGGPGADLAYGVHAGADGSVLATGYFNGTADFDPGTGLFELTSAGGQDAFLVKLTANRPPAGIGLSNSTALPGSTSGTLVGFLSTSDPNLEDTFTYTLVPGTGDADNGAFQIVGRQLQTSATFGGQSSYNIRVRSTDAEGQWIEATFVVTESPTVDIPPEVVSVVRADGNPTKASTVHYTVTFTESVTGVGTDDFALVANGVTGAVVSNVTGSGTTYTVTVSSVSGDGTLRLDVLDDDTIVDSASQPLGGTGSDNGRFVAGETYIFDLTPPQVVSIERVGTSPTSASIVDFTVTFSEDVSGVDATDFDLVTTGLTGVSITNITNQGPVYTVTVDAGTGDGTLRLDVDDDDSIIDAVSNPLGGPGHVNGDFNTGEVYVFDRSPPTVQSIVRAGTSPTDAAQVTFTVTFSENVTGVDTGDFVLTTTGLPGASVLSVTGTGATRSVVASTGTGDGTIRLDVDDDDSILDVFNNPLGGTGNDNGDYTGGETYVIDRTGVIHGRKWDDRDGDSYWDLGEPGLAGVTIYLDLNNNDSLDGNEPSTISATDDPGTTTVDETGEYRFEDLGPGTYYVREIAPTGWVQTFPFTRAGATGKLTSPYILWDNQNGVDGLDEAAGIAISPDGNFIYVASYSDHSLTVFERDPQPGYPTLVQVARNGTNGITGLYQAQSVVMSPDGKHVYVSSDWDDSVVAFSRDPLTGLVTFVERERDGYGGVDGLNRALAVTISPDGKHVYAVGSEDDSVAIFFA